jgi:hypothetical protein
MVEQSNAFFLALLVFAVKVQLLQLVEGDFPFLVVSRDRGYVLGGQSSKSEVQGCTGVGVGSGHDDGQKDGYGIECFMTVFGKSR